MTTISSNYANRAYSTNFHDSFATDAHKTDTSNAPIERADSSELNSLLKGFKTASGKFRLEDIITLMLALYANTGDHINSLTGEMEKIKDYSSHLHTIGEAYTELNEFIAKQGKDVPTPYIVNASTINGGDIGPDGQPQPGLPKLQGALKSLGDWDGTDGDLIRAWDAMHVTLQHDYNVVSSKDPFKFLSSNFENNGELSLNQDSASLLQSYHDKMSDGGDAATNLNQVSQSKLTGMLGTTQSDMAFIASTLDRMNQLYSQIARIGG